MAVFKKKSPPYPPKHLIVASILLLLCPPPHVQAAVTAVAAILEKMAAHFPLGSKVNQPAFCRKGDNGFPLPNVKHGCHLGKGQPSFPEALWETVWPSFPR